MLLSWALPFAVLGVSVVLAWPFAWYMHFLFEANGKSKARLWLDDWLGSIVGRSTQDKSFTWADYCCSMLTFNFVMFVLSMFVLSIQESLPLNPDGKAGLEPTLAFNTAVSFVTNTNLQHYSGEAALSYFSQLTLMWLQFVSAATGIAALAATARAMSGAKSIGDFYRDVSCASFFVLLPLSLILSMFLYLNGVPMTFAGTAEVTTLEGITQSIARGPIAAFVAIKQLGTNGGGFFGTNSTHPFENPTFWTNAVSNIAILLVPMSSVWMFGRITRRMMHAHIVFAVMMLMFLGLLIYANACERQPASSLAHLPVAQQFNLEGKELRFGLAAGPMWVVSTTATSNGSVNAMHDSLNPLTGLAPMIGMWLNVIFGGVGVGMLNMFLFIVLAVFLAGMMVGRTPEYLSRKIESHEMKLALLTVLAHPLFILGGVAIFSATSWGKDTLNNSGSHGLSEIIYEFSSAAANNGSGFEGLGDNTVPWNIATGLVMLFARFIPIIAPLAIAGSLGRKRATPDSAGTFRTDSWMFGVILLGTVLIVGALLFLPLAVLGPIADHLTSST